MNGINSGISEQATEIYIKKVLAGNIENVRARVIDSIESLGYDIIEDEPNIIARRGSKGWGTWFGSADVLDYATTLTVRLKSVSESSTRAVFDYSIRHNLISKGEKDVVLQEAKTIVALSKMQAVEKMCSVCETESTDDSKFCRRCGAPLTSEQAELEVLRMMAETRAGKTSVVASSVSIVISAVILVLTLIFYNADLLKPKLLVLLMVLGGAGFLFSIITSFFGWNRLKRALENGENQAPHVPRYVSARPEKEESHLLQAPAVPASVTEGTTNLLDEEFVSLPEKEKVLISGRRNTNDLT